MRKVIDLQMKFWKKDIADLEFDLEARDEIPKLLIGLQYIYSTPPIREKVFDILKQIRAEELLFLGLFSDNRLVGVLPVYVLRKLFFQLDGSPLRRTGTPPAVPILAPHDRAEGVLAALGQWSRERDFSHFQVTWQGPVPAVSSGEMCIESLDNLEITLAREPVANWKQLAELSRRMVRRAIRSSVKIHWMHSATFLERYRPLLASTYDRQGLNPNFPSVMYQAMGATLPASNLRVIAATYQGRTVAAIWLLCSARRCHYWDASSLEEGRELSAGHLLVWEIVRWAANKGYETVDMVGASVGGRGGSRPGIGRFKQSFGAVPVSYSIVYWQTGLMRLAMMAYRMMSAIHRRLAGWVVRPVRNTG